MFEITLEIYHDLYGEEEHRKETCTTYGIKEIIQIFVRSFQSTLGLRGNYGPSGLIVRGGLLTVGRIQAGMIMMMMNLEGFNSLFELNQRNIPCGSTVTTECLSQLQNFLILWLRQQSREHFRISLVV